MRREWHDVAQPGFFISHSSKDDDLDLIVKMVVETWRTSDNGVEVARLLRDPQSEISREISEAMPEYAATLSAGRARTPDPRKYIFVDSWDDDMPEWMDVMPTGLPPAAGERILTWILPLERAEAVLGDLDEKFRKRLARGISEKEAVSWYYWHVARSSGHFLFQIALRFFGIEQLLRKLGFF